MARNEQEQSEPGYELLTVQCRMARAALGWGVRDLAGAAQVSAHTVARFERGEPLRPSTVRAIRTALEDAGCEFICEDDVSGPAENAKTAGEDREPKHCSRKLWVSPKSRRPLVALSRHRC
jgi:transcriptional regulator with XRE-family HTH domain